MLAVAVACAGARCLVRRAVRRPARVRDAARAVERLPLLEHLLEHARSCPPPSASRRPFPFMHRDARRVVAAVLQALEPFDEQGRRRALPDVSDDSAHALAPRSVRWAIQQGSRPAACLGHPAGEPTMAPTVPAPQRATAPGPAPAGAASARPAPRASAARARPTSSRASASPGASAITRTIGSVPDGRTCTHRSSAATPTAARPAVGLRRGQLPPRGPGTSPRAPRVRPASLSFTMT